MLLAGNIVYDGVSAFNWIVLGSSQQISKEQDLFITTQKFDTTIKTMEFQCGAMRGNTANISQVYDYASSNFVNYSETPDKLVSPTNLTVELRLYEEYPENTIYITSTAYYETIGVFKYTFE